jgi:hypothetical protein
MVLRLVGFAIVMETMEAAAAPQDLLCAIMMSPLVMPFVLGILFGMHLVNLQETQVVCQQEHPCFEGHTMVGIVLEAMAATPLDLFCVMMMTSPLVMPFVRGVLFSMRLVNLQETQVVCRQEHPCFEGHTVVAIILEAMAVVAEDLLCTMMMTVPLVMPFVWGILFGMHLVNLQETQVVCCQEHPCFEGHTVVAIVLEAMVVVAEDLLCAMMMTVPLVMPFVRGILFGMHLVNSKRLR